MTLSRRSLWLRERQRATLALPFTLAALLIVSPISDAHEFWLDPIDPPTAGTTGDPSGSSPGDRWRSGDTLKIDIRNGENFRGLAYPFDARLMARAGVISATDRRPLTGRLGDYPAITVPLTEPGLHLVLLDTVVRELVYDDLEDFARFLDYHALDAVLEHHRERALPERNIREHYYRFAKVLVSVDGDADARYRAIDDEPALAPQQQALELIAKSNPIGAGEVRFTLLSEGTPLAGRQLELFHRSPENTVSRRVASSDANGDVLFDVSAAGDYLLNSVQLHDGEADTSHWVSWWASLFFQQPGH